MRGPESEVTVQAQAEDLQIHLSMPHQMAGPHGFSKSSVQEAGTIL